MSSDRDRILQMVADGTITQEEAGRLLECLGVVADQAKQEAPGGEERRSEQQDAPAAQINEQAPAPPPNELRHVPQPPVGDKNYKHTHGASAIRGFHISWISGPIEIKSYKGSEINVTEYSRYELDEDDKMDLYEENGILKIKWNKTGGIFSLSTLTRLIGRPFLSKQLVIEIPEEIAENLEQFDCSGVSSKIYVSGVAGNRLEFSTTSGSIDAASIGADFLKTTSVSGKVNLSAVSAGTVKASSTSGSVWCDEISAGRCNIDTVSGSIHFRGSAGELICKGVSGSLHAELDNCPDKADFDTMSGSVNLYIPDNDGFTAKYSSMSGKFRSEFPVAISGGEKTGTATYGNGGSKIKIGTVSGAMKLFRRV